MKIQALVIQHGEHVEFEIANRATQKEIEKMAIIVAGEQSGTWKPEVRDMKIIREEEEKPRYNLEEKRSKVEEPFRESKKKRVKAVVTLTTTVVEFEVGADVTIRLVEHKAIELAKPMLKEITILP